MNTTITTRTVVLLSLSFSVAACGTDIDVDSGSAATPPTSVAQAAQPATTVAAPASTSSTLDTLPPPSPSPDLAVWSDEVGSIVNTMQAARMTATETFSDSFATIELLYDSFDELLSADLESLDTALGALTDPPNDQTIEKAFKVFNEATSNFRTRTQQLADELSDRRAELRMEDQYQFLGPELASLADQHAIAGTVWQTACFDLQAALDGITTTPIDCIGTHSDATQQDVAVSSVDPSEVTVRIDCTRGETIDNLPFDTTPHGWLRAARADQGWIISRVTIENRSDQWVAVDDFQVRWLDADGAVLAATRWPEPAVPGLTAKPGQTVIRTGLTLEDNIRGLRGETLPADLLERVFHRSNGCEMVGTASASAIASDRLLDPTILDDVEPIDCRRDDASGRWVMRYRIANSSDQTITVIVASELVDADGNRLGLGGTDAERIPPGATRDVEGWSVLYTVTDVDEVDRCEILSAEVR